MSDCVGVFVRTALVIMGYPREPSAWQAAATPPIMAPTMPRLPASCPDSSRPGTAVRGPSGRALYRCGVAGTP